MDDEHRRERFFGARWHRTRRHGGPVAPVTGGVAVPVRLSPPISAFDLYFALAAFWHFSRLLLDLSFSHFLSAFASFCARSMLPGLAPAE